MPRAAHLLRLAPLLAAGAIIGACGRGGPAPDFNWDVRPILSNNCFRCHGPDEDARKAGLRLDLRDAATAELPESPGKTAIVPGDADASELITRVSSTHPDVVMPPPETHLALTADDVAVLTRGIEAGAEYKPHWAFMAPAEVAPPTTTHEATVGRRVRPHVLRARRAHGHDLGA